jgi:transposase
MKKTPKTPAFKPYDQHQMFLFPPSIEDMIPENHPVRIVNKVLDTISYKSLFDRYPGGGTSSYNPVMLVKVIMYAYLNNTYTSRDIEAALKENIHYMWISGMQQPDHNTINRFRKNKLGETLKGLFIQLVELLIEHNIVSIKELYLDGTKIEANANKYTVVWGNSIKTNKIKMKAQLKNVWDYIQKQTAVEEKEEFPFEYSELEPEKLKETIEKINKTLADSLDEESKPLKKKMIRAAKEWPERLMRYQEQEKILSGRNSYSKTDHDATFMRMKEDGLNNREFKPGYNLEIATNNQIIVSYGVFPNPTDSKTLPDMIRGIQEEYGKSPDYLIADAGYGSEENFTFLRNAGIEAVVKYNMYERLRRRKPLKRPFTTETLHYNSKEGYVVCPMGQRMELCRTGTRISKGGYEREVGYYKAKNCDSCPLQGVCNGESGDRIVEVSREWREQRSAVDELLETDFGRKLYARRKIDVEPVFGNIKHNKGIRRFTLRGKKGVMTEIGLVATAHNLRKMIMSILAPKAPSFA